jgi:hypothetical protein
MQIADVLTQLRTAADALTADHPELAADERAFVDTLDGLTDGLDLAEHLAEKCLQLSSLEDAAIERARILHARARRFAAEQDRLKALILALVDAAGGRKVVRPSVTLSPRNTPARLQEIDASLTPLDYLKTVTTTAPDKSAIREALDLGAQIPGWAKSNGGRSIALLTR